MRWLALLCLSSCIHVHVYTHGQVRAGEGFEPGDRVVAPWHETLYAGTVITVDGKLVTIAWDDGSKSYVRSDRVARVEVAVPEVSEGDWVLCRAGSWQVCRIERLGKELGVAPVSDGVVRALEGDVVAMPSGLAAWAARTGAAALEHLARQREMQGVRPAGSGGVRVGARALASADAGATWLEAEVVEVGQQITVAWVGGAQSVVPAADVAPLGPADFSAGGLVFCKWAGGARWWRAKVAQLSASALSVVYIDGTTETLSPEACTPARRSAERRDNP